MGGAAENRRRRIRCLFLAIGTGCLGTIGRRSGTAAFRCSRGRLAGYCSPYVFDGCRVTFGVESAGRASANGRKRGNSRTLVVIISDVFDLLANRKLRHRKFLLEPSMQLYRQKRAAACYEAPPEISVDGCCTNVSSGVTGGRAPSTVTRRLPISPRNFCGKRTTRSEGDPGGVSFRPDQISVDGSRTNIGPSPAVAPGIQVQGRPSHFVDIRLRYANVGEQPVIEFEKFPVLGPSFPPQCYSGKPRKRVFQDHLKAGKEAETASRV